MRTPIFLRDLTAEERAPVGLRSPASFILRRCQILLASARGQQARPIAEQLGCNDQTVRDAITAFNTHGVAAIQPGSTVAHHRPHAVFDPARRERLRDLLHQRPRTFGHPTSVWTLPLAVTVAFAEGITPRHVSGETIRLALKHRGIGWRRAKHWIISPNSASLRKKSA